MPNPSIPHPPSPCTSPGSRCSSAPSPPPDPKAVVGDAGGIGCAWGGGGGGRDGTARITVVEGDLRGRELKPPRTREKESPVNRLSVILFGAGPTLAEGAALGTPPRHRWAPDVAAAVGQHRGVQCSQVG